MQFRSHFANTACNKFLKVELGTKRADKTDIASTNASARQQQLWWPQEAWLLRGLITASFSETSKGTSVTERQSSCQMSCFCGTLLSTC